MKRFILPLLFLVGFASMAVAQRTVSGTITDSNGESLIGASVVAQGSTVGTITDIDGNFTLEVPEGTEVIEVSYTGYGNQQITLGASNIIDVTMEEGVVLDELVVTALGISKDEKALSYSVQQVNSEEITKTQSRSALESLKGKVAGVQLITASGSPGASTNVKLRGVSSLTGNNEPLFVVDGVPINNVSNNGGGVLAGAVDGGNAVSDINPEDISSISVLKGASAAALYGSRAANGVVLINTKTGAGLENNTSKIEFGQSYAFERVLLLPELQNSFGQGQNGDNQSFLNDQESWGDAFDGAIRPYGGIIGDPGSEFFNKQQTKKYEPLEDNLREFFDIGKTSTTNLAFSGNKNGTSFRISGSYTNQDAIIANTGLERYTAGISGNTQFTDKLSGGVVLNYINQTNDLVINGQGGEAPLSQILQTSRDVSLREQRDLDNIYNGVDWYYTPFIQNPYYNLFNDSYKKESDRVYGNMFLKYDLFDTGNQKLSLTTKFGADVITDDRLRYKERRIASALSANSGADEPGFVQDESYTNKQYDLNLIANYNRTLSSDLGLNVIAGVNFNERNARSFVASVIGTTLPNFSNFSNGTGTASVNVTTAQRRLFGAYTQVEFDYKNWLYVGGTYRQDWSSTLPASNRSFGYPSIYGSAVLSDALDISNNSVLSFLKLRLSYAEVGNDAPVYLTESVYTSPTIAGVPIQGNFASTGFPFNNLGGFTLGDRIGNPNLKPERSKEVEFGIDARLLKNRVGIDFTYFNRSSIDQILRNAQTAPTSGFRFQVINAGEMVNKGVEVVLSLTPIQTRDFEWNVNVNFTKIDNEVVALLDDDPDAEPEKLGIGIGLANYTFNAIEGQPYGVLEAPTALRDPNGNYIVDGAGLPQQAGSPALFGSVQPDWLGGISSSISYKGFSLSALVDHSEGGVVYSRTVGQTFFNGSAVATGFNNRERFIVPFSVIENPDGSFSPNTTVLDYSSNNVRGYYNAINTFGETLILDATFTKLREVAFSYTLGDNLLENLPFSRLTIGVFGRNLWIHTSADNTFIDPEVNSFTAGNGNSGNLQGFEFGTLPSTSTYGFNLKLVL